MKAFDTLPILSIELPDTQEWVDRIAKSKEYFALQGINNIFWIKGIHGDAFGIKAARPYLRDNPEQNWHLEPRTIGGYLSAHILFNVILSHPEWDHIVFLEDDIRFSEGWKEKAEQALKDVPEDFDWLFLSHCCTEGREKNHVQGGIWDIKYPMAGGFSVLSRKGVEKMISVCRDACIPMDVHLFDEAFKHLKIYTLMPRIAEQLNTHLPE